MAMNFERSKGEQLADHLREAIARGELAEPLPNIRDWSARLGVASGTLQIALNILKREGLVRTRPRKGVDLTGGVPFPPRRQQPPFVRLIEVRDIKNIPTVMEIVGVMAQKLNVHGIRLSIEIYKDARLQTLHKQGPRPHELLVFASLSRKYQELFSDFPRSVLLLGQPFSGISLPFISIDVVSAFRHAAFMLARRGFERLTLVISGASRQPVDEEFLHICATAPHPVRGEVVRLPDELYAQNLAAQRLAARITARHALITNSPVHAGLLMLALARRGLRVLQEVEVVSINATSQEIRTVPIPIHYPYPLEQFSKAVCQAAIHYFRQGTLPSLRKMIPLEMVSPPN